MQCWILVRFRFFGPDKKELFNMLQRLPYASMSCQPFRVTQSDDFSHLGRQNVEQRSLPLGSVSQAHTYHWHIAKGAAAQVTHECCVNAARLVSVFGLNYAP